MRYRLPRYWPFMILMIFSFAFSGSALAESDKLEEDRSLFENPTSPAPQDPQTPVDYEDETPVSNPNPPSGVSSGKVFLVSMIGDSHAGNPYMQTELRTKLNYHESRWNPIPNDSRVRIHEFAGKTVGYIEDQVPHNSWGASEGADFMLLMAGTNDLTRVRTQNLNWDSYIGGMLGDMQKIIDSIPSSDGGRPRIILSGVTPCLDSVKTEWGYEFNQRMYNELHGFDLFIETNWYDLYDEGSHTAKNHLYQDDVHPNPEGARLLGENWFDAVGAFFDPVAKVDRNPYVHWVPEERR